MKLKLMRVVGARPQFMQAAVLRQELDRRGHTEILVHTGQHYSTMLNQVFFEQLAIPAPDVNLNVGSGSQGAQTGRMLEGIERTLLEHRCHAVVVDGDTNSTLAGALAAVKLQVPVVHVEAGLRSRDMAMPEEVNRIGTDHFSTLLCAPTRRAVANLQNEGLASRTHLVGDLLYDCFVHFQQRARTQILADLGLTPGGYLLATVHRAESTSDAKGLNGILAALHGLPLPVVFPVHPRTRPGVERFLAAAVGRSRMLPIEPVGYLEMLALLRGARMVLTDSGGVQREAFYAGIPSLVMRPTTEWMEQVEIGYSLVTGTGTAQIRAGYEQLAATRLTEPNVSAIYGAGHAAARIVELMERHFA